MNTMRPISVLLLLLVLTGKSVWNPAYAQSEAEAPFRLKIKTKYKLRPRTVIWSGDLVKYARDEEQAYYESGRLDGFSGDSIRLSRQWIHLDSIVEIKIHPRGISNLDLIGITLFPSLLLVSNTLRNSFVDPEPFSWGDFLLFLGNATLIPFLFASIASFFYIILYALLPRHIHLKRKGARFEKLPPSKKQLRVLKRESSNR